MESDSTFKDHYIWELQRRDSLNSALAFPVGIIALLFGAVYAMSQVVALPASEWIAVLGVMLVVTVFLLFVAVIYLVRSYWGYTYKHIPLSGKLLAYKRELSAFYIASGQSAETAKALSDVDFVNDLNLVYAQDCEINSLNNDSKSSYVFKANLYIIGAIATTFFCATIFLWVSKHQPEKVDLIRVTNLKELSVNTPTDNNPPSSPLLLNLRNQSLHGL